MSSSDDTILKLKGKVDDDEVDFELNQETKSITYTANDVHVEIPAASVIAVANIGHGTYRLIYASDEGASDEIPVGPIKAITTTGLPERYVNDFPVRNFPNDHVVHVVISIASGTRQAEKFYTSRLVPVLNAVGLDKAQDYEVLHTTSEFTITEITNTKFIPLAQSGTPQTIILLSGDGGIVDIVNTVFASSTQSTTWKRPVVALLPLGTGNALAHSTKVTADSTCGLGTLLRGTPTRLPVFRATFSPGSCLLADEAKTKLPLQDNSVFGCVVLSWGLHASLVADSDTSEYRKHGLKRFQLAAKENLFPEDGKGTHKYLGRVSLLRANDWEGLERKEHAYVLATFVSNLEKTFTISPDSKPLDGRLRIVHFGSMSGEEVMSIMGAAYQDGKHVEDERVGYESVKGVRVDFDEDDEDGRWRRVCVDGKIIMVEKGGWVEVKREEDAAKGINVLCLHR